MITISIPTEMLPAMYVLCVVVVGYFLLALFDDPANRTSLAAERGHRSKPSSTGLRLGALALALSIAFSGLIGSALADPGSAFLLYAGFRFAMWLGLAWGVLILAGIIAEHFTRTRSDPPSG